MTRKQRKPKALEPTGPVFYQESHKQTGPQYAYKASCCDILCGWPAYPSFKKLDEVVKDIGSAVLAKTREHGSRLVHFEGPLADIERIKAWAAQWRKDYREAHNDNA